MLLALLVDKATHRSLYLARPAAHQELVALRLAFETKFRKLENQETPSKSCLWTEPEEIKGTNLVPITPRTYPAEKNTCPATAPRISQLTGS